MQKKAEQKNYLRQNPHLKAASPEKAKKKKKARKKKNEGSYTSGLLTRRMTPKNSSQKLPQLTHQSSEKSMEASSFVFKRPDLLKDALAAPSQNYLRRMTQSHNIRDFKETKGEPNMNTDDIAKKKYTDMD